MEMNAPGSAFCEECAKVPWRYFFDHRFAAQVEHHDTEETSIAWSTNCSLDDLDERALICPICRHVRQSVGRKSRRQDPEDKDEEVPEKIEMVECVYYILSLKYGNHYTWLLQIDATTYNQDEGVEESNTDDAPPSKPGQRKYYHSTFFRPLYEPSDKEAPAEIPVYKVPGAARRIRSSVDIRLPCSWRTSCDKHCGFDAKSPQPLFCNNALTSLPKTLARMINTERLCLANVSTEAKYAALSYVWGAVNNQNFLLSKTNLREAKQPDALKGKLPATIEDAVSFAAEIGYKYLFVDAICIVQDDASDIKHFIDKMHVIYAHADLTIVAASSTSAGHGIAGLSQPRNVDEDVVELPVGTLLKCDQPRIESSLEGLDSYSYSANVVMKASRTSLLYVHAPSTRMTWELSRTNWNSRGWTFQELLLSKRLLVFTNKQIFWRCRNAVFCEDTSWEFLGTEGQEYVFQPDKQVDVRHQQFWGRDTSQPFYASFHQLARDFSRRKLKFDRDSLGAFVGIMQVFRNLPSNHRLDFFWAMPKGPLFPRSMMWTHDESYSMSMEPPVSGDKASKTLWTLRTEETIRRDTQNTLPSWSWIGWKGHITWPVRDWLFDEGEGKGPYPSYYSLDPSRKLIPLYLDEPIQSITPLDDDDLHKRVWMRLRGRTRQEQETEIMHDVPTWLWRDPVLAHAIVFQAYVAHCRIKVQGSELFDFNCFVSNAYNSRKYEQWDLSELFKHSYLVFWRQHVPDPKLEDADLGVVVIGKHGEDGSVFTNASDLSGKEPRMSSMLIVRWEDGIAHREGLLRLPERYLRPAFQNFLMWRTVVMV